MRKIAALALLLSLFTAAAFAQQTDGQLTKEERKQAVDHLKQTKKNLHKAVKGLSAEQLNFKSAPDRWSVADVIEHLALSEELFNGMILGKIMKSAAAPEKRAAAMGKEQELMKVVVDRSQKFQAPEPLRPGQKRWATIKDALKAFDAKRNEHIAYLQKTKDPMHHHFAPMPGGTAELDGWQWMLFMSGHVARHTAQIEEVKSDPNFPRK